MIQNVDLMFCNYQKNIMHIELLWRKLKMI